MTRTFHPKLIKFLMNQISISGGFKNNTLKEPG